jgi:hypothetical protein
MAKGKQLLQREILRRKNIVASLSVSDNYILWFIDVCHFSRMYNSEFRLHL